MHNKISTAISAAAVVVLLVRQVRRDALGQVIAPTFGGQLLDIGAAWLAGSHLAAIRSARAGDDAEYWRGYQDGLSDSSAAMPVDAAGLQTGLH